MENTEKCPCGSGATYGECCGPIHDGKVKAKTAEALMRARYSAYAAKRIPFLRTSAGPEVQAEFDEKTTAEWSKTATWEGLEIVATEKGEAADEEGFVSFVAHYTANGQLCEHRELAYFKKIDGAWRFIDGKIASDEPYRREMPKVGRNDPCPCGSGKKYKKCCGKGQ